jgi:hypothetical protein
MLSLRNFRANSPSVGEMDFDLVVLDGRVVVVTWDCQGKTGAIALGEDRWACTCPALVRCVHRGVLKELVAKISA